MTEPRPVPAAVPRRSLRLVRPHEVALAANAVGVNLLITRALGSPIRPAFGLLTVVPLVKTLAVQVLALVAVKALVLSLGRRRRRAVRLVALMLLSPRRLLELVRAVGVFALVSYGYSWLKVFLPVLREDLFDRELYALDNVLHLGVNPNRFLLALLEPFPAVLSLIDLEYAAFVPTLVFGIAWFLATPSDRDRRRFTIGFSLLWLAGSWLYFALPSLGPCYALPDDYARVKPSLPRAVATQDTLIRHYGGVRSIRRATERRDVIPVLGVAAFPSLHVGAHAFLALWARRRHRPLFYAYAFLTFATFVGSLVTGWHYAVDGYAGIVLALAANRVGGARRGLG